MRAPERTGLRFHAPLAGAASGSGLRLTPAGRLELVRGDEVVRQAIGMLLAVRPGERVMRPDYGCRLHELAFQPNDETTAGMAVHYVRRALEQWMPEIEVLDVDARRGDADPERLDLEVRYRVKSTGRSHAFTTGLDLVGGGL